MVAKRTTRADSAAADRTSSPARSGPEAAGEAGRPREADGASGRAPEKAAPEKTTKAAARKTTTTAPKKATKAAAKKTAAKKATKPAAKKTGAERTSKKTVKKAAGKQAGDTTKGRHAERRAGPGPAGEPRAGRPAAKDAAGADQDTAAGAAAGGRAGRESGADRAADAAVDKTGAHTVAAKKTAGGRGGTAGPDEQTAVAVSPAPVVATVAPGELPVRPGEDPWTEEEVTQARTGLEDEAERLTDEITSSERALVGLMRDSADGAGDDEADTGTKNITREHEMALAGNAREMLEQTQRALQRLDAGTYGLCEVCGKPIGKARMQAFPRATLCVEDKQKQERRA
ncbi:TraR/DksA family transcriptional regulator [Streptomyces sp. NBC_01497]|uniref:TraR/DksA family transcriptional regulator n=1 Tax=Streptomyces sp. NBC_01497 TaxID=2903885 RepID=UPI002E337C68|nr:TraR/DksA C4-type zinc finger protein [Streptomyces sp. NBC_01497]